MNAVSRSPTHGQCSVAVDDVLGGDLAVTHLLEQQHERIAFVGGPFTMQQVADRKAGITATVQDAGDVALQYYEVDVMGVEGVAWMFADFESRWADEALRQDILNVARALEAEPSTVGVSAHLLGIGRKL